MKKVIEKQKVMKKKIIISFILLFMVGSVSIFADNDSSKSANSEMVKNSSINGVVKDGLTGETLVGVEVVIEGTDLKVYTDFDGKFVFEGVNLEKCNLVFSMISYNKSLYENYSLTNSKDGFEIEMVASE